MKVVMAFFLSVLVTYSAFGQREMEEDSPWTIKDRGYLGLGLSGLSFGNSAYYGQYFSIGVGALGGYMLTKSLSAGVGLEYQYTTYPDQKYKAHVYGWYPFVRYNIKNFFLQFDYDMLRLNVNIPNYPGDTRQERFLGGIGFFNQGQGRSFVNFLVSYDFLYTSSSYYGSPLTTRLFFTF